MTTIIDIHTHTLPIHPEMAIWNCTPTTLSLLSQIKYASFGLHPWTLSTSSLSSDEVLLQQSLDNSCFIALGEAGLDKLCNTPYELQMQALCFQAKLADKLNIPLILHVVKAHNEVMRLKSELKPRNAWIIHGFRGKPELAQQYLQADFPSSLRLTRLFLLPNFFRNCIMADLRFNVIEEAFKKKALNVMAPSERP